MVLIYAEELPQRFSLFIQKGVLLDTFSVGLDIVIDVRDVDSFTFDDTEKTNTKLKIFVKNSISYFKLTMYLIDLFFQACSALQNNVP